MDKTSQNSETGDQGANRTPRPVHLWVDQYGAHIYAPTAKALRAECGGGRLFKVYVDTKDGRTKHIGYGVGRRWFRRYAPVEKIV